MTTSILSSRAAVLGASRQLDVRKIPVTELPAAGGWIAVEACGMCGSDWNWYANREIPSPFIPGHEIVGTIVETWGETAAQPGIRPGARIVVEEAIPCRACAVCRSGRHRVCPRGRRYGQTALSRAPRLWGGYAEMVFLDPLATVHAVPSGLESDLATLFVPVSNGISWLRSAAELRPGESVLVIGVGQHGLATVAAARRLGASTIIAAGRAGDEGRLEAAGLLGADIVVDVDRGSLSDAVAEATGGQGVDVTVDAAPLSTTVVGEAVALAAIGGRVIVAGVKNGSLSPINTDLLHRREVTVRGVAARESWAIDAALGWLRAEPHAFGPFGSLKVGLDSVTSALLALGGEDGGDRPLHAVVDPRC